VASTFISPHFHLVFSTKGRAPMIADAWRSRLHEYLGGTVKDLGGIPEAIGGAADHVHLLVGLKATHCLADFMRELKKASSMWVHETIGYHPFAWQEGYAAFSVSATARPSVRGYIDNQEEHHRELTSREELLSMLQLAKISFDERFLD
jgi:putative transposase